MANPLGEKTKIGTIGELFVQLKLLELGVQAAPPLKDSGNDLIAIKEGVVKFIQVKTTTTNNKYNSASLPKVYHFVAWVKLKIEKKMILFDKSEIFFIEKDGKIEEKKKLSESLIDNIWPTIHG